MGLTDPELISVIIATQSFVMGIARMEIETIEAAKATGRSDEDFWEGQRPFLERAMLSGEYPRMAALAEDTFSRDFDHFEFGLGRLVAGLEALVRDRASSPAGTTGRASSPAGTTGRASSPAGTTGRTSSPAGD